jgi:hypothetical protein
VNDEAEKKPPGLREEEAMKRRQMTKLVERR